MIGSRDTTSRVARAVDHIGLVVRDADAAAAYYIRELGLPMIHDEVLLDHSARLVWIDGGNVLIQLVQPIGAGPVADFLDERGEGLHHLCFSVTNLAAALATLGAETRDGIFPGGRGKRACFLKDRPFGLLVEMYEEPAP